jgi:CRP-like cAMP-binding protein
LAENHTAAHRENRLLAALPATALSLLAPRLKLTPLRQGEVVFEFGDPVDRVYFPRTGVISLLVVTSDGAGIETATIGREGAVGLHCGLGKRRSFTRAVTLVGGEFFSISADNFEKAARDSEPIRELIERYTEVLWAESQQIAACNAVHNAEARLCRWLLQSADRLNSDVLPLTQEFLAQMLGVRRTTITLIARTLQTKGVIEYRRGRIVIHDRKALEACACECYHVIQHHTLPRKIGVDFKAS